MADPLSSPAEGKEVLRVRTQQVEALNPSGDAPGALGFVLAAP
jgi:hypothetical protein